MAAEKDLELREDIVQVFELEEPEARLYVCNGCNKLLCSTETPVTRIRFTMLSHGDYKTHVMDGFCSDECLARSIEQLIQKAGGVLETVRVAEIPPEKEN